MNIFEPAWFPGWIVHVILVITAIVLVLRASGSALLTVLMILLAIFVPWIGPIIAIIWALAARRSSVV